MEKKILLCPNMKSECIHIPVDNFHSLRNDWRTLVKDYLHSPPFPDEILSTVFITLVLRPSLTVTCSLERSWIPPTPNLSPHISLYWLGWCSYCSHKVIKYKCPGHLEVVSRPKVIVSNSPSWLSSHLILLSDPWERQCTTKCRGWSNPLKHLNIKEQLVCCEQNSFWLLQRPPHQPAPSCRDGSWIVQTGETGFNQKEVETGSMGGAPQGV